jgi:hypothetical protein
LSLLLFTFYFHQGTRFMAGPTTLLLIFSAVFLAQWIERRTSLRWQRRGRNDLIDTSDIADRYGAKEFRERSRATNGHQRNKR